MVRVHSGSRDPHTYAVTRRTVVSTGGTRGLAVVLDVLSVLLLHPCRSVPVRADVPVRATAAWERQPRPLSISFRD